MNNLDIGRKLREARKERGLTQDALASKLGTVTSYISDIERGVKSPSLHTFIRILEILNVPANYVLPGAWNSEEAHVGADIQKKVDSLTHKQQKFIADFIDLYIQNLE